MKLTRVERWILSNQYRILAALRPDEADHLEQKCEALDSGYELHYGWLAEHIVEDTMSEDECKEVLDILAMFDGLRLSYKTLSDKSGIDESDIRFQGFDGNNETKQMGYAQYFCLQDDGRFTDIVNTKNLNSHMPTMWRYQPMLREFKAIGKGMDLTKDEILRVVNAARAARQ